MKNNLFLLVFFIFFALFYNLSQAQQCQKDLFICDEQTEFKPIEFPQIKPCKKPQIITKIKAHVQIWERRIAPFYAEAYECTRIMEDIELGGMCLGTYSKQYETKMGAEECDDLIKTMSYKNNKLEKTSENEYAFYYERPSWFKLDCDKVNVVEIGVRLRRGRISIFDKKKITSTFDLNPICEYDKKVCRTSNSIIRWSENPLVCTHAKKVEKEVEIENDVIIINEEFAIKLDYTKLINEDKEGCVAGFVFSASNDMRVRILDIHVDENRKKRSLPTAVEIVSSVEKLHECLLVFVEKTNNPTLKKALSSCCEIELESSGENKKILTNDRLEQIINEIKSGVGQNNVLACTQARSSFKTKPKKLIKTTILPTTTLSPTTLTTSKIPSTTLALTTLSPTTLANRTSLSTLASSTTQSTTLALTTLFPKTYTTSKIPSTKLVSNKTSSKPRATNPMVDDILKQIERFERLLTTSNINNKTKNSSNYNNGTNLKQNNDSFKTAIIKQILVQQALNNPLLFVYLARRYRSDRSANKNIKNSKEIINKKPDDQLNSFKMFILEILEKEDGFVSDEVLYRFCNNKFKRPIDLKIQFEEFDANILFHYLTMRVKYAHEAYSFDLCALIYQYISLLGMYLATGQRIQQVDVNSTDENYNPLDYTDVNIITKLNAITNRINKQDESNEQMACELQNSQILHSAALIKQDLNHGMRTLLGRNDIIAKQTGELFMVGGCKKIYHQNLTINNDYKFNNVCFSERPVLINDFLLFVDFSGEIKNSSKQIECTEVQTFAYCNSAGIWQTVQGEFLTPEIVQKRNISLGTKMPIFSNEALFTSDLAKISYKFDDLVEYQKHKEFFRENVNVTIKTQTLNSSELISTLTNINATKISELAKTVATYHPLYWLAEKIGLAEYFTVVKWVLAGILCAVILIVSAVVYCYCGPQIAACFKCMSCCSKSLTRTVSTLSGIAYNTAAPIAQQIKSISSEGLNYLGSELKRTVSNSSITESLKSAKNSAIKHVKNGISALGNRVVTRLNPTEIPETHDMLELRDFKMDNKTKNDKYRYLN